MFQSTRREFLGTVAAGTAAYAAQAYGAADQPKLRLGVIGVGWYGMVDAKAALKAGGVEIAAICDVDSEHLKQSADELEKLQGKRPRTFKLYDDLLDAKGLDAVIIATPPHWHALQFIAALEQGLDVYCEKPLAYDIREGRAMVEAAKQHGRIVQIGFQRRQSKAFREVREFIAAGKAGRIVQVDAQIHYNAGPKDATPQPPPASLDWDLWCGPGPKIPYSPQVGHFNWRLEKTSGHGHLVDWGIHLIDACAYDPGSLHAEAGHGRRRAVLPEGEDHHAGHARRTFRVRSCAGRLAPPHLGRRGIRSPDLQRHLLLRREGHRLLQRLEMGGHPAGEEQGSPRVQGRGRRGTAPHGRVPPRGPLAQQPSCSIEDAYRSTATVQLAMIAYETGLPVRWDAAAEQITNNPAGQGLLKREYRPPWKHPFTG